MAVKNCTKCGETKPVSEFNKHKRMKDGLQSFCAVCKRAADRKWSLENKDKVRESNKARYAAHTDKYRSRNAQWRAANPERKAAMDKAYALAHQEERKQYKAAYDKRMLEENNAAKLAWRSANLEKTRAVEAAYRERNRAECNARASVWKKANPKKLCEYAFLRSSQRRKATPKWANRDAMLRLYRDARRLTKETGVEYHVDHIVPLLSNLVCGLHCESNLRVITQFENISKLNRYWPDMP